MDSPPGQTTTGANRARAGKGDTPQRLMKAAAELIAEVGWGRVTTRAVAARADLPHGAVSYHFPGKQQLLTDAALDAFERAFPEQELAKLGSVDRAIAAIEEEMGSWTRTPALSSLMLEAMREAERDPELRERLGALLQRSRRAIAEAARADQERGALGADVSPAAIAAIVIAVGDGLLLHRIIDPQMDTSAGLSALRAILRD